jgi:hypothetical protein
MLATAQVGFRLHRFEILVAVLVSAIVTITAVVVILHLSGAAAQVPAGCWDALFSSTGDTPIPADCEAATQAFSEIDRAEASWAMAAMWVLPFAVGLLIGVPLVGYELEARTAETTWALAGSRRRWLAYLVVPALALVLIALGVAAAAAEILATAREPWLQGGPGWQDVGLFGPIVVARAAVALGVGLLTGAVVGRTLPALLLALVVCAVILFVTFTARQAWMEANKVELDGRNGYVAGGVVFGRQMFIDAAGAVLTTEEAYARVPPGLTDEEAYPWIAANMREVYFGVPASAVPAWERLEVIGLGAASALLLAGTFVVVDRRRPR